MLRHPFLPVGRAERAVVGVLDHERRAAALSAIDDLHMRVNSVVSAGRFDKALRALRRVAETDRAETDLAVGRRLAVLVQWLNLLSQREARFFVSRRPSVGPTGIKAAGFAVIGIARQM